MGHLGSDHRYQEELSLFEHTRVAVGRIASEQEEWNLNIPPGDNFDGPKYRHRFLTGLCLDESSKRQTTCLSTLVLPRSVSRTEQSSRRRLLGSHSPTECKLTTLVPGSEFRISKMNLVIAKAWQGCPMPLIATLRANQLLGTSGSLVRAHSFREQVNPDIKGGEPVK
ncbi:hypothetical protein PENSUB_2328 [Penicillium subrubescens]|uniref:Uncharacterized protein n=1 Tax=Penicillium subrubescens TaxID=1316194 RepID=A0A1Q5UI49_9EURO|nr:hypothetical protein PENSUB_2328 [Penicillium subrubescens]